MDQTGSLDIQMFMNSMQSAERRENPVEMETGGGARRLARGPIREQQHATWRKTSNLKLLYQNHQPRGQMGGMGTFSPFFPQFQEFQTFLSIF